MDKHLPTGTVGMYSEQHVEIASFHTLLDKARHGARYVFETN